MGYCTRVEVELEVANALSSGTPNTGLVLPITTVGNSLTSTVTDDQLNFFIRTGDEIIDAAISSIYQIPLTPINRGSFQLITNATLGDNFVLVTDATRFTPGDTVQIRSGATIQRLSVTAVPNPNQLNLSLPLSGNYTASQTLVERIAYPDPIPKISARLAAANLFDKHFAAQQEPNESEFGKYLRKRAFADINGILAGTIRLLVPDAGMYVGRRYQDHYLSDVTNTAAEPGKEWYKD
jgi:hypothetical protein